MVLHFQLGHPETPRGRTNNSIGRDILSQIPPNRGRKNEEDSYWKKGDKMDPRGVFRNFCGFLGSVVVRTVFLRTLVYVWFIL